MLHDRLSKHANQASQAKECDPFGHCASEKSSVVKKRCFARTTDQNPVTNSTFEKITRKSYTDELRPLSFSSPFAKQ